MMDQLEEATKDKPFTPTQRQADLRIHMECIAGNPSRSVEPKWWEKSTLDDYPTSFPNQRTLFSATPISENKQKISTFRQRAEVPTGVNGSAETGKLIEL